MTQNQDQAQGSVVTIKLMSQVENGPIHELGSYELTAPDQAPACTARILREVADEFESLDRGGVDLLDDETGEEGR